MKAFTTLLVVAPVMPILALSPVPASLPPAVRADMEVMVSIVSVLTVLGLMFLSLLALCAEKGEQPFRRAHQGFRRLPAWEKTLLSLFVGIWIAFANVKDDTNDVNQVEGETNTVSGQLMLGFFGRPNLAPGVTPSITEEDISRMWRVSSETCVGGLAAPTANAITNAAWSDYGGMSDAMRIKPEGWRFPYGDKSPCPQRLKKREVGI